MGGREGGREGVTTSWWELHVGGWVGGRVCDYVMMGARWVGGREGGREGVTTSWWELGGWVGGWEGGSVTMSWWVGGGVTMSWWEVGGKGEDVLSESR